MTLRLFFHSDDLKASVEVLDCTPCENEFAVVEIVYTRREDLQQQAVRIQFK